MEEYPNESIFGDSTITFPLIPRSSYPRSSSCIITKFGGTISVFLQEEKKEKEIITITTNELRKYFIVSRIFAVKGTKYPDDIATIEGSL
jgi:hypothetical protein